MGFRFEANFSQAKGRSGGMGQAGLPTGYYAAKTLEVKDGEKPTSVLVQLELTEEGFEGMQRRVYLGTDASKAGNVNSWFTAYDSHGFDVADLGGELAGIDSDVFIGNECRVFIKAKDPNDTNSREDVQFVTRAAYEKGKEEMAAAEGGEEVAEEEPVEAAPAPAAKPTPAKPTVAAKPTIAAKPTAAPTPAKPAGGLKNIIAAKKQGASA